MPRRAPENAAADTATATAVVAIHDADRALIDRYLEMLAAERGAARNTQAAYARDLHQAATHLAHSGGLIAAGADRLRDVIGQWAALAPASQARKQAALAGFFRFLLADGLRDDDPAAAIARPTTRRPLPRLLGHDDVAALFTALQTRADGETMPRGQHLRLLIIVELLYGSGLRVSEACALPRLAFSAELPYLIIRGKGDKERLAPLSERARLLLGRWTTTPDPAAPHSPHMFPSRGKPITRVRIFKALRAAAAAAGNAPDRNSPHVIRHAFATHLM